MQEENRYEMNQTSVVNEPIVKSHKRGSFFKKAIAFVVLGLLFGTFAGGSFYAVTIIGKMLPFETILESGSESSTQEGQASESESVLADTGEDVETQLPDAIQLGLGVDGNVVMDVSAVTENVMPSVVSIDCAVDYDYYGYESEAVSSGSGIIVGENDTSILVVTNYHVIEGAKEIKVVFSDESSAVASVKGKNVAMDVAVVAVDYSTLSDATKEIIKVASLGDSNQLKVGQPAIAIGNALGYGQSVTTGVISALNRQVELTSGETGTFIQTDAAINPGNSGGALINMAGEVIGINSNKLGGSVVEGMGYAIPISVAKPIIEDLMQKEELVALPKEQQAFLGISGATVSTGTYTNQGIALPIGVYVSSVTDGAPASNAGILRGDIITSFDGNDIISMEELKEYLEAYPAGTTVTIKYKRMIEFTFVEKEAEVTLGNKQ